MAPAKAVRSAKSAAALHAPSPEQAAKRGGRTKGYDAQKAAHSFIRSHDPLALISPFCSIFSVSPQSLPSPLTVTAASFWASFVGVIRFEAISTAERNCMQYPSVHRELASGSYAIGCRFFLILTDSFYDYYHSLGFNLGTGDRPSVAQGLLDFVRPALVSQFTCLRTAALTALFAFNQGAIDSFRGPDPQAGQTAARNRTRQSSKGAALQVTGTPAELRDVVTLVRNEIYLTCYHDISPCNRYLALYYFLAAMLHSFGDRDVEYIVQQLGFAISDESHEIRILALTGVAAVLCTYACGHSRMDAGSSLLKRKDSAASKLIVTLSTFFLKNRDRLVALTSDVSEEASYLSVLLLSLFRVITGQTLDADSTVFVAWLGLDRLPSLRSASGVVLYYALDVFSVPLDGEYCFMARLLRFVADSLEVAAESMTITTITNSLFTFLLHLSAADQQMHALAQSLIKNVLTSLLQAADVLSARASFIVLRAILDMPGALQSQREGKPRNAGTASPDTGSRRVIMPSTNSAAMSNVITLLMDALPGAPDSQLASHCDESLTLFERHILPGVQNSATVGEYGDAGVSVRSIVTLMYDLLLDEPRRFASQLTSAPILESNLFASMDTVVALFDKADLFASDRDIQLSLMYIVHAFLPRAAQLGDAPFACFADVFVQELKPRLLHFVKRLITLFAGSDFSTGQATCTNVALPFSDFVLFLDTLSGLFSVDIKVIVSGFLHTSLRNVLEMLAKQADEPQTSVLTDQHHIILASFLAAWFDCSSDDFTDIFCTLLSVRDLNTSGVFRSLVHGISKSPPADAQHTDTDRTRACAIECPGALMRLASTCLIWLKPTGRLCRDHVECAVYGIALPLLRTVLVSMVRVLLIPHTASTLEGADDSTAFYGTSFLSTLKTHLPFVSVIRAFISATDMMLHGAQQFFKGEKVHTNALLHGLLAGFLVLYSVKRQCSDIYDDATALLEKTSKTLSKLQPKAGCDDVQRQLDAQHRVADALRRDTAAAQGFLEQFAAAEHDLIGCLESLLLLFEFDNPVIYSHMAIMALTDRYTLSSRFHRIRSPQLWRCQALAVYDIASGGYDSGFREFLCGFIFGAGEEFLGYSPDSLPELGCAASLLPSLGSQGQVLSKYLLFMSAGYQLLKKSKARAESRLGYVKLCISLRKICLTHIELRAYPRKQFEAELSPSELALVDERYPLKDKHPARKQSTEGADSDTGLSAADMAAAPQGGDLPMEPPDEAGAAHTGEIAASPLPLDTHAPTKVISTTQDLEAEVSEVVLQQRDDLSYRSQSFLSDPDSAADGF